MRAAVLTRFGSPDVLEVQEIPIPAPGVGEILVRLIAASANPIDAKIRQDGYGIELTLPAVLGVDGSGIVERIGPGVHRIRVGDPVFFAAPIPPGRGGTYAEYCVVAEAVVALKPKGLSHSDSAAIPLAGGTAWEGVVRRLKVRPGERVLVIGAAGGVGSFAVQFARASGASVIGVSGSSNQAVLRELGVEVPVDYTHDDLDAIVGRVTEGAGVDAVFDTAGGLSIRRDVSLVRPFGRIATLLPPDLGDARRDFYRKNLSLHGIFHLREGLRLEEMRPMFESHRVRPLIETLVPLEQIRDVHRRLDSGHGRGKVGILLAPEPE